MIKTDNELLEQHKKCCLAYYNGEEPIMTDADFNELELEILKRGLDVGVGASVNYGDSEYHFTKMLSLKKENVGDEFTEENHKSIIDFLSNSQHFNIPHQVYALHYKLDGLAINAMYEKYDENNNILVKAVTRGDGTEGRNVIEKLNHILPKFVPSGIKELRYECIIPTNVFNVKYIDDYSHPRNLASGILNDVSLTDARKFDLDLILLSGVSVGDDFMNLETLKVMGICGENTLLPTSTFSNSELCDYKTFKEVFEKFDKMRPYQFYPTDGLVISSLTADVNDIHPSGKYPNYSISIKFKPKGSEAIVSKVVWNLKKSGVYTPIVHLEGVVIDGRNITKTHGFNYDFIMNNSINKGAKVLINIAGDIIPFLVSVIKKSDVEHTLPIDGIVKGCQLVCLDSDAINIEKFIASANSIGFKHFGESFFRKVVEYYEYNVFNIFNLKFTNKDDLLMLGLSELSVTKFIKTVKEHKSIKLSKVIQCLNFKNCGESTSIEIAKYLAKYHYDYDENFYLVDYDFFNKNIEVVESAKNGDIKDTILETVFDLNNHLEIIYCDKKPTSDVGENTKYIMTGSPKQFGFGTKAEFSSFLGGGYTEVKNLKDTHLLVTDDLESKTSKMKTAEKLGITIKTYGEF